MWLFVLMAAVIFFRFQVQQSKKENETLLGIVAALLAVIPRISKATESLWGIRKYSVRTTQQLQLHMVEAGVRWLAKLR